MNKIVQVFLFLALNATLATAQTAKYSNAFLSIGVGARGTAMGGAVAASTDDVTATYWNPAGLMDMQDNLQLSFMHNEQFAGIAKHDFGAIGFKLNDNSRAAISMIRLGVDGIPNTLYLMQDGQVNYNLIKDFSAVDYGFFGTYASKTKIKGLNIGGNVKVIRRVMGDFGGAWGFGIDAAVNYNTDHGYCLAFVGHDITGTFNAWSYHLSAADQAQLISTGNSIPKGGLEITLPRFTLGASKKYELFNKFTAQPEINFDLTTDGRRNVLISSSWLNVDPRAGVELGYNQLIYLRGGVYNLQRVKDFAGKDHFNAMPSLGVGIKLKNISFDYALGNAFNQGLIGMSNIISVRISINKKS